MDCLTLGSNDPQGVQTPGGAFIIAEGRSPAQRMCIILADSGGVYVNRQKNQLLVVPDAAEDMSPERIAQMGPRVSRDGEGIMVHLPRHSTVSVGAFGTQIV